MNISLLVTNYKKTHLFKSSLDSIVPQLVEGDEICFVDDAEYDGARELLHSLPKWISWKYNITGNKSYRSGCKAKNIALKMSENELCVINDPEVWHYTKCIDQIKNSFKKDKKLFIVPGSMYSAKDITQDIDVFIHSQENVGYIPHSMAPFIGGVLRDELFKVGGWDERFKYWGNDDNDLMHRLGLSGCKTYSDDRMIAFHQWHPRPPQEAMGDANESLLYDKNKSIVANKGVKWGEI